MKKILISLFSLLACFVSEAKVVKVTLADGTVKVYTSSELSAIDFNEDGTLVITTYDGRKLPALDADYDELSISDEATVSEVFPDTLKFSVEADGLSINLHSTRAIKKMNYVYPSVDPFGQPITLSGTILMPENIWTGECRSEGILMVNHYTKFHRDEAPTLSNGEIENMLLANPLKPNYIIVESDFYGFGATDRFPQAFMQGLVNARASLDGLLAARELLTDMGFDYGPLCFNIGYSSGGFDALASQKLRDMEYADQISFDKTFSGGGPSDVREAYRQYVLTDSTAYNAVPLLLMVCTNETQRMNLDYSTIFQPYIAGRIDELILSKNFSSWPVCDSIGREKKIHEILSETYCDLESPESQAMQDLFDTFSMTNDEWTPDLTQRIYLFHSRGDDYVPIQSARPMISFLKGKGFEPSIIPGRTNLQTNFVVRNRGHLSATLIYFIQTLAAIEAWPKMYTDGQLNPLYQAIVSADIDIVMCMRHLDAMGFDCRALISRIVAVLAGAQGEEGTSLDLMTVALLVHEQLQKAGFTEQELMEMAEDSGLDVNKLIFDLYAYFTEQPETNGDNEQPEGEDNGDQPEGNSEQPEGNSEQPEGEGNAMSAPAKRAARLIKAVEGGSTPVALNEKMLREWLGDYLDK